MSTSPTTKFTDEGEILGSKYRIVLPDTLRDSKYNGVYIWCHGYRPIGIPLNPVFDYHSEPYATLLRRGFLLASLSYRREGYILKDAVEDIDNLRRYICEKYFPNGMTKDTPVLLEAESMGGAIVTLLNERYTRNEYAGIVATGAALFIQNDPPENPIQFLHTPHIPQIFICNSSEVSLVKEYISKARENKKKDNTIIEPVLLTVEREGHCEVFIEEIQIAFSALFDWIKDDTYFDKQQEFDITIYDESLRDEANATYPVQFVSHTTQTGETIKGAWVLVDEITLYNEVILKIGRTEFHQLFIYPYNSFELYVSKTPKVNEKFDLEQLDQVANRFSILHASYPFAGIDMGTLVSSFNVDNLLIIRKHFTGNNLNEASTLMGLSQMANWVFIKEKSRTRTNSTTARGQQYIQDRINQLLQL